MNDHPLLKVAIPNKGSLSEAAHTVLREAGYSDAEIAATLHNPWPGWEIGDIHVTAARMRSVTRFFR